MAKLSKKAIETLSVNAVRDSIMTTDHLDQFIPDNDKEQRTKIFRKMKSLSLSVQPICADI